MLVCGVRVATRACMRGMCVCMREKNLVSEVASALWRMRQVKFLDFLVRSQLRLARRAGADAADEDNFYVVLERNRAAGADEAAIFGAT